MEQQQQHLKPSDFLEKFATAREHFKLFGGKLLVERLEMGEIKSKGGLIIPPSSHAKSNIKSHEPMVCLVLAVGEGYTQDDGTVEPLDTKPGNIIIVNGNGVNFFSTLPGVPSYTEMKVGLTTESDVQLLFPSVDAYEKYCNSFNQ